MRTILPRLLAIRRPALRLLAFLAIATCSASVGAVSARAEIGARPANLSPADQGWVDRVEQSIGAIGTLKARFLQIAPDGATTQGTAWLDRPGRMRFEYDKPSPLLLVANDGQVVFHDSKLDQTTTIPLDRTPLGLLLSPRMSFSGPITVTGFTRTNQTVQVVLQRTATPGDGSLTLVFSEAPFGLHSWIVVDAQGRETRVDLYDVTQGGQFPASLFDTGVQPGVKPGRNG